MAEHELWELRQKQSLPMRAKVAMSEIRIMEWYDHFNGNVYVSFSGGKDSTVLAHLVHRYYPDVPLVFSNTGLEYPEIQAFARKMGAEFVRPKMSFSEVISTYGYPIISKEVAEAIHYARRIVPHVVGVERGTINQSNQTNRDARMLPGRPGDNLPDVAKWTDGGSNLSGVHTSHCRKDLYGLRTWNTGIPRTDTAMLCTGAERISKASGRFGGGYSGTQATRAAQPSQTPRNF